MSRQLNIDDIRSRLNIDTSSVTGTADEIVAEFRRAGNMETEEIGQRGLNSFGDLIDLLEDVYKLISTPFTQSTNSAFSGLDETSAGHIFNSVVSVMEAALNVTPGLDVLGGVLTFSRILYFASRWAQAAGDGDRQKAWCYARRAANVAVRFGIAKIAQKIAMHFINIGAGSAFSGMITWAATKLNIKVGGGFSAIGVKKGTALLLLAGIGVLVLAAVAFFISEIVRRNRDIMRDIRRFFSTACTCANGGFLSIGQYFIAREAGPELVGTIGNRTAVVNNNQIVESVSRGVYGAFKSALNNNNSQTPAVKVKLYTGGRQIATAVGV